jgi:ABC-type bacteriocin/lantibiotic exporter with double-glycine peptidase domain
MDSLRGGMRAELPLPKVRPQLSPIEAPKNSSFISIANLSKEYPNSKQIIRDLSLTATLGEFVGLLGSS